jgi:pimeloyl-ACP methyl ester carboxylesterase
MENLKAKFHQWLGIPYKLHIQSVGDGPAIVFLHGIATSSVSWNYLTPLLSQQYRCITIDLLGFGESPKPDWYDYTPKEHVKNIHHTIKKLNIEGSFVLVGHSMGGLLAMHYASKYPKKVSHLVMLSPPIYSTVGEIKKAKKVWRETLYVKAYQYLRTHKNFTLRGANGLKMLALKNNPFLITETTWNSFSKSLENSIEKQNVVADMEQIFCPVDIFYGTLDQLLIKKNIHYLSRYGNVKLHPLRGSHVVSARYASSVATLLKA